MFVRASGGGSRPTSDYWKYFGLQGLSYTGFTDFPCDFEPEWVVYTYWYLQTSANSVIAIEYDVVNGKVWREFQGQRSDITSSWLNNYIKIASDGKTIQVKQYNSAVHNNQCYMWAMGHP